MALNQTNIPAFAQTNYGTKPVGIWIRSFIGRLTGRRKYNTDLGQMSKQRQYDIGLTAAEIQSTSSMPLSADVVTQLSIRANSGPTNW